MKGDLQVEASGFKNPNDSDHPKHGEGASIATCRFCFGDEEDDLISPCKCKGTQQFVHRSCLDYWRFVKVGQNFSHCSICKAKFHLRYVELEDNEENSLRKIKFRQNVARDVCLFFLAVQLVIGMVGVLTYILDKDDSVRNSFDVNWQRILSRSPPFYFIWFLAFFWLPGFVVMLRVYGWRAFVIHSSILSYFRLIFFSFDKPTKIILGSFVTFPLLRPPCSTPTGCLVYAIHGIIFSFFISVLIIGIIRVIHDPKRELTQEYVVVDLRLLACET